MRILCRAVLLSGVFACAVATAPAAADNTARGLIVKDGQVQFNGIAVEGSSPQVPLQNGGYPLHQRSASPIGVLKPGENRKVIMEMSSRYDRVRIPVPTPAPDEFRLELRTAPDLPPR